MKRIFLALALLASAAFASDDPVADVRKIMAGTVTTQRIKQEYLDGKRDGTSQFQGALKAYKEIRAAEKAPVPSPHNPAPPPSPNPTPAPTVPAPTLAGEAAIADKFNPALGIKPLSPVYGFPSKSGDPVGAFRFLCGAGQLLYEDPIVFPGMQGGAQHLHQFIGNTGANKDSTYQSLRTTGGTTCGQNDAAPLQRSAYWIPAMLDGVGNAVKPDFMLTYYKALPSSDPACGFPDAFPDPDGVTRGTKVGICTPLPNGLRFVFGYDMKTGKGGPLDPDNPGIYFTCVDGNNNELVRALTMAPVMAFGCPLNGYFKVAAVIPACWDGKNLDSPDHRSHMAYALFGGTQREGRSCPKTHPYRIPEIAAQFFYRIDANFLAGKWKLSLDDMAGKPAGATMHMDYWEAWSPVAKAKWQAGCIDQRLSCNNGQLNMTEIIPMETPPGGWPANNKVPLSSIARP